MAKFLVLSLLRTRFDGDIVVFKNSLEPLFMVPRAGVREVFIETQAPNDEKFWDYAQSWKFRVRHQLEVTSGVLANACGQALTDFFKALRLEKK